jgi:hypothetical protein
MKASRFMSRGAVGAARRDEDRHRHAQVAPAGAATAGEPVDVRVEFTEVYREGDEHDQIRGVAIISLRQRLWQQRVAGSMVDGR